VLDGPPSWPLKVGAPLTRRGAIIGGAAASGAFLIGKPARAKQTLRLGHALPASHPVHKAMANFADIVEERSAGELSISLYADGLIGQEPDLIEQVRAGRLDFTKASASVLDALSPGYQIFNIPFLLRNKDHWRRVVFGPVGEGILQDSEAVLGLTFYDAGARSFYGQRSILQPDDLRGLKIRVQPSPSTVRMIELLDAKPVPMAWSVVYSALQTRIVDGAENNLTALIYGRHAEVTKYYSFTEHTIVPDVLLMSRRSWEQLSRSHQSIIRSAATESALLQSVLWDEAEAQSRQRSMEQGVVFQEPDKTAFAARLSTIKQEFAARQGLAELIAKTEKA
jgi:tripartite ATP-independent transporter DctP family solute receptor